MGAMMTFLHTEDKRPLAMNEALRKTSVILGVIFVLLMIVSNDAEARWGSITGGNPYCTKCHSTVDANAVLYVAINGTEMASPAVNISTSGGTFEIDWFYTNIADTAKSVGTLVQIPAATWSVSPGTDNTQSGANFTASWKPRASHSTTFSNR